MKNRIFSLIKYLIGWPFSLLALFFIGKLIVPNLPKTLHAIAHIQWALFILSLLCFLAYFFLRAVLWRQILYYKKHQLPFMETAFLWALSEMRRYIPGNVWSILSRTHSFGKKDVANKTTLSGWAVESEYIFFGGGLAGLLSLGFMLENALHLPSTQLLSSVLSLVFCGVVIAALFTQDITKILPGWLKKIALHSLPHFSFWENLSLLSISTAAFAFLGLGSYCGITSVYPLPLNQILTLASFFVLSMVIGFASLITPMGLGVREAFVAAGLLSFYPLSIAGFLAFFARLLLIAGELIFLGFLTLWHQVPTLTKPLENFIGKYIHELIVGLGMVVYTVYFTIASFLRYTNFYTGRFDLGNMDQTVWNTAHGRIFTLTNPDGTNIISRLSFHADFILVLLAPLYAIWQDPRTLLFIQSLVSALGALFVFLIAKDVLKNKTFGTVLALFFLLSPQLEHANLYDFHAVTLATTFLLGAYYFMLKKNGWGFVIFLLLSALTKEQVWVVTALLGLQAAATNKLRRTGIVVFVTSLVFFWFIFFKAIPKAHGGGHFALGFYADFGSSPAEILKTLVFAPNKTFAILSTPDRIEYLRQLFYPLGFLPLLAPLFLVFTLPDLLINLLSSNPPYHQIYYQYSAVILPFLFIATIYGVLFIIKRFRFISVTACAYYLVIMSLIGASLYGPLPGERFANTDMFTKPLPYANDIDEFLAYIPARYSIAASNNVGSHLSHRQKIFTIPTGIDEADVIVFLLNDQFAQPSPAAQRQMVDKLKHDANYAELFEEGDFIVFAKQSTNFQKRKKKIRSFLPFVDSLFPLSQS